MTEHVHLTEPERNTMRVELREKGIRCHQCRHYTVDGYQVKCARRRRCFPRAGLCFEEREREH